ncbi:MAG TPA: hypothetical protein DEO66_07265 [Marinobacter adhaerens]|nr:hypothetical protein [Marinobacter adhaerens]
MALCVGLFLGSLRSGQRAAAVMTLIQSAMRKGHDPYGYPRDVLTRLPTQKSSAIGGRLQRNKIVLVCWELIGRSYALIC